MTRFSPSSSGFSSPPCLAHELQPGQNGYEAVDLQTTVDVARWRNAERQRLIELRLTVPARERQLAAQTVGDKLDELLKDSRDTIVSVYWPFRGELNLRDWMQQTVEKEYVLRCQWSRESLTRWCFANGLQREDGAGHLEYPRTCRRAAG